MSDIPGPPWEKTGRLKRRDYAYQTVDGGVSQNFHIDYFPCRPAVLDKHPLLFYKGPFLLQVIESWTWNSGNLFQSITNFSVSSLIGI